MAMYSLDNLIDFCDRKIKKVYGATGGQEFGAWHSPQDSHCIASHRIATNSQGLISASILINVTSNK
jgi:hypothetical protein